MSQHSAHFIGKASFKWTWSEVQRQEPYKHHHFIHLQSHIFYFFFSFFEYIVLPSVFLTLSLNHSFLTLFFILFFSLSRKLVCNPICEMLMSCFQIKNTFIMYYIDVDIDIKNVNRKKNIYLFTFFLSLLCVRSEGFFFFFLIYIRNLNWLYGKRYNVGWHGIAATSNTIQGCSRRLSKLMQKHYFSLRPLLRFCLASVDVGLKCWCFSWDKVEFCCWH